MRDILSKCWRPLIYIFLLFGWILFALAGFATKGKRTIVEISDDGKTQIQYLYDSMGRMISMASCINADDIPSTFSILIENKPVYIEVFGDQPRNPSSIMHFDKGFESYVTHYHPDGSIRKRLAEYRNADNELMFEVYDLNIDGNYLRKIEMPPAVSRAKLFFDNKWQKVRKEDGQYGVLGVDDQFIPLTYLGAEDGFRRMSDHRSAE